MSYICTMTVDEILTNPMFNTSEISKQVFGGGRIISDKINRNRNKRWLDGDKHKIADYFKKKYQINLEVT